MTVLMDMRVSSLRISLFLLLANILGCGSSAGPTEDLVPVSGTVLFDGAAVEGISVVFVPTGKNTAHTGFGTTDSDGQFVMFNYQKKEGLPVGDYIATFSFYRMVDGSAPPTDRSPMKSGAIEMIPPLWNRASLATSSPGAIGPIAAKKKLKGESLNGPNFVTVPKDGITDLMFKIPKR